jgi:hypothetical protein
MQHGIEGAALILTHRWRAVLKLAYQLARRSVLVGDDLVPYLASDLPQYLVAVPAHQAWQHEGGAEAALRIIRLFRQAGVTVVSVQEPWLNGAGEVQDVLVAFAGWVAERESARKSERIRNGLRRRRAEGKPVGRQPGAADKKKRKRAGYVASWEGEARRAAHNARAAQTLPDMKRHPVKEQTGD